MYKTVSEYEQLIRNSAVFSLDKTTHPTAYKREALKLIDYLYRYLTTINASKYAELGLEITETAKRCLKNYTPENGDFLHYFNAAIAKEQRKSYTRQKLSEQHGGIHIPENDQRIIRKYIKFTEHSGDCRSTDKMIDNIASLTGIARDKISQCITDYKNSFAVSDTYQTSDGTEASIFDLIPTGNTAETEITEQARIESFILRIDNIFSTRQARQKPLLAKLLTAKLAEHLIGNDRLLSFARSRAFFSEEIFAEACRRRSPITAREIAVSFQLSEQSVSRTYKTFIALL